MRSLLFLFGRGETQFSSFVHQDALQRVGVFVDDRTFFVVLAAVVEHQAEIVQQLVFSGIPSADELRNATVVDEFPEEDEKMIENNTCRFLCWHRW